MHRSPDASGTDEPPVLAGVPLPRELFTWDPALQRAFIRFRTLEASFFTTAPADAVRCAAARATGAEPRRRISIDHYYDTPGRGFFRGQVSVRLREYVLNPRPLAFEVLAVSWRGSRPQGPLAAHPNRVVVQTFGSNTHDDLERLRDQYARAGLVRVAEVGKSRAAFDVLPVLTRTSTGGVAEGADHRGIGDVRGELRVVDLGVKVLVDELHEPHFAEPTVVEVEYDERHTARAVEVMARLRRELGPVRTKERNKIVYLLGAA